MRERGGNIDGIGGVDFDYIAWSLGLGWHMELHTVFNFNLIAFLDLSSHSMAGN